MLNMAANGVSSISGTQTALTGYLSAYLNGGLDPQGNTYAGFLNMPADVPLIGGDWKVVWGPSVCLPAKKATAPAANAAYIAYSPSQAMYVVAIAATNPTSFYDWISEDGNVSPIYMARWPITIPYSQQTHLPWLINPPSAVSSATALGVSNVLTLTDPNTGLTIGGFLKAQKNISADTLIFTGHSLAGALSPSVAEFLYPDPSASGFAAVYVLPTAGATPGNGKFANDWNSAYPSTPVAGLNTPYAKWNTDFANERDVVPHAWNQLNAVVQPVDSSGNYPTIFGVMGPNLGKGFNDAITAGEDLAAGGFYTNINQSMFPPNWGYYDWSSSYPPVWTALPVYTDSNLMTNLIQLGQVFLATHIDQYLQFFGTTPAPKFGK
jgi:hypothetical protein